MLKESTLLVDHWIIITLLIVLLLLSWLLFSIFKRGPRIGQVLSCVGILIYTFAIVVCFIAKLDSEMNSKGITFTYPPFTNEKRVYSWNSIKLIKVVQFDALTEFGGWGNKHSAKYGDGYLTKGRFGLFIIDKNDKKLCVTVIDTSIAHKIITLYFKND